MRNASSTMNGMHAGAQADARPGSHPAVSAYRWCIGTPASHVIAVFADTTKLPARRLTEASP